MSGLTTTGSTVLTGSTRCRRRSTSGATRSSWLGGLGIIVLAVAVLPLLGVGGMQLYKGQAPGTVKDEQARAAHHRDRELAVAGLRAAHRRAASWRCGSRGMSWFDAICHAFSAVGLGGFSTHDASIAYFNSPAIELVLMRAAC